MIQVYTLFLILKYGNKHFYKSMNVEKYDHHRYHNEMKKDVNNAEREKPGPCLTGGANKCRDAAPALCFPA